MMTFPSVKEVVAELRPIKLEANRLRKEAGEEGCPEDFYIEVRLQVWENGDWNVHSGDPSCDDDHTGFWGMDSVGPDSDLREIARGMIEEVKDWAYIHGEVDQR